MARIKKDDIVKIISGKNKGVTGKVIAVLPKKNAALIENVGTAKRKVKPSQINPQGGMKDIHVPTSMHKIALVVDEKSSATIRRLNNGKNYKKCLYSSLESFVRWYI